ncbi:MAG TPA: 3-isopropylmalate dehydratase small subunit, partial [Coleofasciculaceae cyanobacterium]
TVSGKGIPLVGNDIDTDRIIPARFLRCVTFDGLGEQAFADDRAHLKGEHPFDQPQYQGANILVVNGNFGCGSSREHAPQALSKWGIQAILGESFAEIFFGNCVAIGIPCLRASAETVQQLQTLLQENPHASITVDLEEMQVRCGDFQASVSMSEGPRQMLTTGTWDTCGQLIAQIDSIRATVAKLPYLNWDNPVTATAE